jgi:alpha-tubulin suppressor-like RCC1 family protein
MTTPTIVKGKRTYNIGEWITQVYKDEKAANQMRYLIDKIDQIPPPPFHLVGPFRTRKTINVSPRSYHLLVCAYTRDVGSFQILYSSGLNQYGQLGFGNNYSCETETNTLSMRCREHISLLVSTDG